MTHVENGVGHFDVAGPDMLALTRFYTGVFGWAVNPRGPGYALVETPDGSANGALVEAKVPALTIGVVVRDLDGVLAAAVAAGGSVAMPATDNGWVTKAIITDPAGNRITLIHGTA
jgi:predicted enzyme related to lactoylglutathione lyase